MTPPFLPPKGGLFYLPCILKLKGVGLMPHKPKTACKIPGCPALVESGILYCPAHEHLRPVRRDYRKSASKRGYGTGWVRIRAAYLMAYPTCARCGTKATEVHHIVPKRDGGQDTWDNLMPLCSLHHKQETARETKARNDTLTGY